MIKIAKIIEKKFFLKYMKKRVKSYNILDHRNSCKIPHY